MKKFILSICCLLSLSPAAFAASELTARPGIYHSAQYPECNFNVETRGSSLIVIANLAPSNEDVSCNFGRQDEVSHALTNATLTFQCSSQDFSYCATQKIVTNVCPGCTSPESWYQFSSHLMDDGRLALTQNYQSYYKKTSSAENNLLYFAAEALEPFVFHNKARSADPDLSLNINCDLAKAAAVKASLEKCHQFYYSCTMQTVEFKRSAEGVSCSATAFISGSN